MTATANATISQISEFTCSPFHLSGLPPVAKAALAVAHAAAAATLLLATRTVRAEVDTTHPVFAVVFQVGNFKAMINLYIP